MHTYAKFVYAMLAFGTFQATFSKPVSSENSHSLIKRAAQCDPRLGGLSVYDCRASARQIPHTETPIQFQPDNPNRLVGLPFIWSVGECTIAADLINIQDPEYITFLDIAHAAHEVIHGCVRPSRYGGSYVTGAFNNFRVTLYQFDYADEETHQVGPDPTGTCAVKGEVQDVETCVLAQAALSGFSGP